MLVEWEEQKNHLYVALGVFTLFQFVTLTARFAVTPFRLLLLRCGSEAVRLKVDGDVDRILEALVHRNWLKV